MAPTHSGLRGLSPSPSKVSAGLLSPRPSPPLPDSGDGDGDGRRLMAGAPDPPPHGPGPAMATGPRRLNDPNTFIQPENHSTVFMRKMLWMFIPLSSAGFRAGHDCDPFVHFPDGAGPRMLRAFLRRCPPPLLLTPPPRASSPRRGQAAPCPRCPTRSSSASTASCGTAAAPKRSALPRPPLSHSVDGRRMSGFFFCFPTPLLLLKRSLQWSHSDRICFWADGDQGIVAPPPNPPPIPGMDNEGG